MARPSVVTAQTDFSAGELDPEAKRLDNNPIQKVGLRQALNWRILDTRGITNRPGRRGLFPSDGRVEELKMTPTASFFIAFGAGALRFYTSEHVLLSSVGGFPWTASTVKDVVWAVFDKQIYITFPGMVPQVVTWNGVVTFTPAAFAESLVGNQKRTIFYRFAPKGITLLPSGLTGAITVTASQSVFTANYVGTRLRYQGRQILITGFTSATVVSGTVQETLLGGQRLAFSGATGNFNVGDVVTGTVSGAQGQVVAINPGVSIDIVLLTVAVFQQADTVVGPAGSAAQTSPPAGLASPPASVLWDEELISAVHGYPESVFVDQNRLGFCNFPALPSGIAWSAVSSPTDFYVGALPTEAIFELAPNRSQIFYVMPGPESNEIVFADNRIYYIPINTSNALKPGSVAFNQISTSGISRVEPRAVDELILYIDSGGRKISGLFVLGAYNRPYRTQALSQLNAHLFIDPIAIALPNATDLFPERYVYILNSTGSVVVGKYSVASEQREFSGVPGFLPWNNASAFVTWVSAFSGDVLFTTQYSTQPGTVPPISLVELLDSTLYLDAALKVNQATAGMQHPVPAGTNFGNMVANGGLAAAFDGNRNKIALLCASVAATPAFIGRIFNVPQRLGQAIVYPSADEGFVTGGTGPITFELRAKQTVPLSATDGTLLATMTLQDESGIPEPIVLSPSLYDTTKWVHGWITIQRAGIGTAQVAQLFLQTGPLWWIAGNTVDIMDAGTRYLGVYQVDIDGVVVPQNTGGENLLSEDLVSGLHWVTTCEPFIPPVQPGGQDVKQRQRNRSVKRFVAYVMNSSGFGFQSLFGGPLRPGGPALGASIKVRYIPPYNQGDDQAQPPPLREQSYQFRPLGSWPDPRNLIFKDGPGPLTIVEITTEVTV